MFDMLTLLSQTGVVAPPAYIGTYSEADFISFSALQTLLVPEVNYTKTSTFKYFVFTRNGKTLVIPSAPLGRIAYKTLYERGGVYGVDGAGPLPPFDLTAAGIVPTDQSWRVTINGQTYRVRLFKGSPAFTYVGVINDPQFIPSTEWEDLYYNMYSDIPSNVTRPNNLVPSKDRVVHPTGGSPRIWHLVQGLCGTAAAPQGIGRGRYDLTTGANYGVAQIIGENSAYGILPSSNTSSAWLPILELV